MAAAAAATCWISAGTSLYSHRLSTSTPPPSSPSSSCLFIPKAAYRNQHNKEKKDVGKEKSLWRSNDGRLLTSKDGRSSKNEAGKSTAVKSTGLQRKVAGKGALFESKEQQVETGSTEDSTYLSAVVKVFSTRRAPAYSLPWTKQMQSTSTGSAFMIGDGKLLTNAHCVEDAYQVKVKRRGDDTKYVAKVLAIGMECDIALLSVENKDFWKGAEPLNFGNLPHLQDAVTVVGYPFGGDTISVTKGVVSRIEVMRYAYGSSELLGIQIDAAINPGNSGGPAFNDDGECIGVAFQVYRSGDTENIGYVIPTTVVSHFLEDHKRNGKYSGFPYLGTMLQKLENPALRACLKVPSNEGILVQKVDSTYDVSNVLKEGDVIVSFDGVRVGCEGTVPFRSNERIAFRYLISQKFIGDIVELGIIRAGEFMKVQAVMKPRVHLVPHQIKGGQPSYLIVGGLVFTPLSGALIEEECEDNIGLKLLTKARYSAPKFKGEQIVVISLVIANEVNIGYEHIGSEQILKLNGRRIKNIHHLAHLVDSYKGKYLVLEFAENFVVVLDREAALSSSASILEDYCIPAERSRDLLEPYLEDLLEPFIDSIGPDEATDLDDYGDSPVSNSEIGYDGLLWA